VVDEGVEALLLLLESVPAGVEAEVALVPVTENLGGELALEVVRVGVDVPEEVGVDVEVVDVDDVVLVVFVVIIVGDVEEVVAVVAVVVVVVVVAVIDVVVVVVAGFFFAFGSSNPCSKIFCLISSSAVSLKCSIKV